MDSSPRREQHLDHLTSREEKELRGLSQRRARLRTGRFLVEGIRVVEELLASSLHVHWVLAASSLEDSGRGADLLHSAERLSLPVRRVPDPVFESFAQTDSPQGVLAVAGVPDWQWRDLLRAGEESVLLVLDGVQDPGNYGTLIRTAEALGVAGAVALTGTVDSWNPKAIRAAAGSSFRVPVVSSNWDEARERLNARGYRVLASQVGGTPIARVAGGRLALVVGNEGAGMSPAVAEAADQRVGIPLRGPAESLNVAAAAAIMLYELLR